LEPYTVYTVRLSAFTEAGEGPFVEFTVWTDEDGNCWVFVFVILSIFGVSFFALVANVA